MKELINGLEQFKFGLKNETPIRSLQSDWARVIDSVITTLCRSSGIAIFGLGGYGKSEMSPYSDIDLLFLYEGNLNDKKNTIDSILYPLWEAKFEAGGATRTIFDCKKMFDGDIRAQTAMLSARFIAGNSALAKKFEALIKKQLQNKSWQKKFVAGKFDEQRTRLLKFGGSVYVLEPHIKEGEGGLREFQTASWIKNILDLRAVLELDEQIEFLFRLRAHLHFSSGKRDDRLTFENQLAISKTLGSSPHDLMSEYYKTTSEIHNESEKITNEFAPWREKIVRKFRDARVKKIIGNEPSWQRLVANRDVIDSALFLLHRSKELKDLVPSFEKIYFKTQYGAYHVYTVDVHSIFAVQKLVQLEKQRTPKLTREVYKKIKRKDMALLAALLHDIGKGEKGDHQHEGAKIAKLEALRLGYSNSDAETVSFLVKSHLVMPKLAFSRDLTEKLLIENFANSVENIETLEMMFVLAYADISSIGPDVWTVWKEKLLDELYVATRKMLSGEKFVPMEHKKNEYSDIRSTHTAFEDYSEFVIMTRDAPGIFAKIAGVMATNNVNILEARLNTDQNGVVRDVLRVQNELQRPVSERSAARILAELEDVFENNVVPTFRSGLCSSPDLKVGTTSDNMHVVIDNDVSVYYTVVDIFAKDRIGLLYDISSALFNEGCTISVAKIITKADEAEDSFYIQDLNGQKIVDKERVERIKSAITDCRL